MAATESKLGELHELITETYTKILRDGIPVRNEEGEIVGYDAPAPAYLAGIVKFLKDNEVYATPEGSKALQKLAESLPKFDEDEGGLHGRH